MFDWSVENGDESGKSHGILISCLSGNPHISGPSFNGLPWIHIPFRTNLCFLLSMYKQHS